MHGAVEAIQRSEDAQPKLITGPLYPLAASKAKLAGQPKERRTVWSSGGRENLREKLTEHPLIRVAAYFVQQAARSRD